MCELFANFLQLMVQGEFVRIVEGKEVAPTLSLLLPWVLVVEADPG